MFVHNDEGNFKNEFRSGKGRMTLPNGNVYSGDWSADIPDGPGELILAGGVHRFSGRYERGYWIGTGDANSLVYQRELASQFIIVDSCCADRSNHTTSKAKRKKREISTA